MVTIRAKMIDPRHLELDEPVPEGVRELLIKIDITNIKGKKSIVEETKGSMKIDIKVLEEIMAEENYYEV
ncbi:MAG: hypothetical protein ACUVXI_00095 [bacterium]